MKIFPNEILLENGSSEIENEVSYSGNITSTILYKYFNYLRLETIYNKTGGIISSIAFVETDLGDARILKSTSSYNVEIACNITIQIINNNFNSNPKKLFLAILGIFVGRNGIGLPELLKQLYNNSNEVKNNKDFCKRMNNVFESSIERAEVLASINPIIPKIVEENSKVLQSLSLEKLQSIYGYNENLDTSIYIKNIKSEYPNLEFNYKIGEDIDLITKSNENASSEGIKGINWHIELDDYLDNIISFSDQVLKIKNLTIGYNNDSIKIETLNGEIKKFPIEIIKNTENLAIKTENKNKKSIKNIFSSWVR